MRTVNGLEEKETEARGITLGCVSVIIFQWSYCYGRCFRKGIYYLRVNESNCSNVYIHWKLKSISAPKMEHVTLRLWDNKSPVFANGVLNHCSKLAQEWKMLGSRKFNSAHNSGSLFCSGVPVSKTLWGAM